uniref:Uncharacterized protein n=1 Tax=Rhizophora mucronata TaxID=61149 RepID=A0A2P2LAR6_RHIMU
MIRKRASQLPFVKKHDQNDTFHHDAFENHLQSITRSIISHKIKKRKYKNIPRIRINSFKMIHN